MVKVTGLEQLEGELRGLSQALEELDGELGSVRFDPHDPSSIDAAIKKMEAILDSKTAPFLGNDTVDAVVGEMKAHFREAIVEKAAEARLEGGNDE